MVLSSCPCTLTRSPDRDRSGALCCLTFAQDQLELNMSRSACKQFLACQQFVLSLFDPLVTTPFFSHFAYNTSTFSNRRMRSQSAASSKTLHSLACMLDSTSNAGACLKKGRHLSLMSCYQAKKQNTSDSMQNFKLLQFRNPDMDLSHTSVD